MKKITMKEIAKIANVSQPTVSRVINGHKGVSEEKAKVMKVIEELGYIPNKAAQTLKRNNSNIIGVCVTEIHNPYFVEIIDALEIESRKYGFNILFHNSNHNPVTEWENIQNFISRQVDGIILVPTSDFNIERISKLPIPAVLITKNWTSLDSVGINHLEAGRMAGKSFILAGHKKFGFIGAMPDDKFFGYASILEEYGFHFDKKHYIQVEEPANNSFIVRRDIEKYLDQNKNHEFTCLFAANDIMALEFLRTAQTRNIHVPEDISIIGFDDTYLSKMMEISSIHQPIGEMAKTTFQILLSRINQEVTSDFVNIMLEPTLIERKTSLFKRS